jgi:hypothetical protein
MTNEPDDLDKFIEEGLDRLSRGELSLRRSQRARQAPMARVKRKRPVVSQASG